MWTEQNNGCTHCLVSFVHCYENEDEETNPHYQLKKKQTQNTTNHNKNLQAENHTY